LIAYAFWLAPPNDPQTFDLILRLSSGQWAELNPLVVALFNLMGLWPGIYLAILLSDGQGQSLRAWPFASLSFAVGAFAILPYLALRQPNPQAGEPSKLLTGLDSPWYALSLLVPAVGLLVWGLVAGNWADFAQQFASSRFIHVMSLDFVLLTLLFPTLLSDDLARRGLQSRWGYWGLMGLPLIGAAVYLLLSRRPK
jgi:hypothetical protein